MATLGSPGSQLDPVDTTPVEVAPEQLSPAARKEIVGRSPGQLAWLRLRRDKVGMTCAYILLFFVLVGIMAPVIEAIYGQDVGETFPRLLNRNAEPLGYAGGISADHWFGIEPRLGRDVFLQIVFGIRTSLLIGFLSAVVSTMLGIVVGVVAGYVGGWLDNLIGWFIDFVLALPFLVFALAVVPIVQSMFFGPREEPSVFFRIMVLVTVFAIFGWVSTARLVRGQVLSLREREYVEAARAAGAGTRHILFRQLLPNIWAPILITFSLAVPGYITAEGALSFLGVGIPEPAPDLGRMIYFSTNTLQGQPAYFFFPAITLFLIVLTFNLFGDSVRDALDPKSSR